MTPIDNLMQDDLEEATIKAHRRYIKAFADLEVYNNSKRQNIDEKFDEELLAYERLLAVRRGELKILLDRLGYIPANFVDNFLPE